MRHIWDYGLKTYQKLMKSRYAAPFWKNWDDEDYKLGCGKMSTDFIESFGWIFMASAKCWKQE
jgi:hypothetical protein